MAETVKTTDKSKLSRKTKKKAGRVKRVAKLKTDLTYKKALHEGKSKRSTEKKAAFRKKKKGKK